jgi:hypothetical protein
MFVRKVIAIVFAIASIAIPLQAQGNGQCATHVSGPFGGSGAVNVCNAGVDGASLFMPVAGILVAGGNPFLGATGGLGGFPHLGVTMRANATQVVIPDLLYNGVGTTVGVKQTVLAPAPLVEAALGVYRGSARGNFAIDLLGSAQLLPTKLIDDLHIDINATRIGSVALGLGVGGRLTLLGEGSLLPAVTVSVMRRTLPRIGVGDVLAGDKYSYASDLTTTDYRATVGKQFGPLDLGAGAGWTTYQANAQIVFVNPISNLPEPSIYLDLRDSRGVGFVDAGLALGRFYLIGEAGVQEGKDLALVTTFTDNDPKSRRIFGSLGIRFGL